MKTCAKCKIEFPATTEYFYKNKQNKDGLYSYCKKCKLLIKNGMIPKAGRKILRTKEEKLEYQRTYYKNNREKILLCYKRYHEKNKDKISEYFKSYYSKNKEKLLIKNRKWNHDHKEYMKQYRIKNRDRILIQVKKWQQENKK